ncbi:AMP-binding protein [Spongiibacter thalassae]|nr:AMP-binding protein [Spongiibacter thalassae]
MGGNTLIDSVRIGAERLPDAPVLRFVHTDENGVLVSEVRCYRELLRNASTLAAAIAQRSTDSSGNIALMMNNHPEFVEAMLACGILNRAFVPIDPRARGVKLEFMLTHTECTGLLCADYSLDQITEVLAQTGIEWLLCVNSSGQTLKTGARGRVKIEDYHQALSALLPIPAAQPVAADSPMFMMFTSGTTGKPKAVVISHAKYMAQAGALKNLGVTNDDVLYTGLSLTHINAQNFLRNSLELGIPLVISRKFSKSRLWDICREFNCSVFSLLGGMIPEIYAVPEQPSDADNPMRLVISSGMPAAIWQDFEKRFGVKLVEVYGATEGGGLVNPGTGPVGSIGKPSPDWEAQILNSEGRICQAGEVGEICFRRKDGAAVHVDYYKNAQAAQAKVTGGWLHMGDLGHRDEDGWFYFHSRSGGGVRRNGDFVNTALVESVLIQFPAVTDAFVYGVVMPKNVSGEKTLVAAVVMDKFDSSSEAQLQEYCQRHLEKNDVPEIFQFLEEIPKTVSEKPIERECVALLESAED